MAEGFVFFDYARGGDIRVGEDLVDEGWGGGKSVYCYVWGYDLKDLVDVLFRAQISHSTLIVRGKRNKQHAHLPLPSSSWHPRLPPPWEVMPGLSSHLRRVGCLLLGIGDPLLIVIRFFFVILPWLYAPFQGVWFLVFVVFSWIWVGLFIALSLPNFWSHVYILGIRQHPRHNRIPSRSGSLISSLGP